MVQCFVVRYFVSIRDMQSSSNGNGTAGCFALFVFLLPRDYCVFLPHDATGLSTVCDRAIS